MLIVTFTGPALGALIGRLGLRWDPELGRPTHTVRIGLSGPLHETDGVQVKRNGEEWSVPIGEVERRPLPPEPDDTAYRLTRGDLEDAAGRALSEAELDQVVKALDAQDWTSVVVDAVLA